MKAMPSITLINSFKIALCGVLLTGLYYSTLIIGI